jgi:hypothetical protein
MLQAGARAMDVAQYFGCSRQTIHNISIRFCNTGSVHGRPRSGAPLVTSLRDDTSLDWITFATGFCVLQLLLRQLRVSARELSEIALCDPTYLFVPVDQSCKVWIKKKEFGRPWPSSVHEASLWIVGGSIQVPVRT